MSSSCIKITSKIMSATLKSGNTITDTTVGTTLNEKNQLLNSVDETLKRPSELHGSTYKLRTPLSNSSIYITINDIILNEGTEFELRKPFEIFINCKEMENFQWVVALTRLISAIFRKGGDLNFIIEELKSVFDPNGGYLSKSGKIPSLVAEIALIIEKHFIKLGLINPDQEHIKFLEEKKKMYLAENSTLAHATICPKCGAKSLVVLDNCPVCLSCGYSKCG